MLTIKKRTETIKTTMWRGNTFFFLDFFLLGDVLVELSKEVTEAIDPCKDAELVDPTMEPWVRQQTD